MINPIQRTTKNETQNEEQPKKYGLNVNYFMNSEEPISMSLSGDNVYVPDETEKVTKKKRGRPKKVSSSDIITDTENHEKGELSMLQSNTPYQTMYDDTNMMLKGSIFQLDTLGNEIKEQIDAIKGSKTLKRKYDYMSALTATASNLIGTKITAIKEINKSITDANNLDLKRVKDLKLNENKVDDDKAIMDMYNAFISTPVGTGGFSLGPSASDITMMNGVNNMVRADIGSDAPPASLTDPLSPSENMMRLRNNPNIDTVVVYDASTGARWFDVVDKATGQSVPNTSKPDAMFLEDTQLDTRNGIARNTNLDTTYPLVIINNDNLAQY